MRFSAFSTTIIEYYRVKSIRIKPIFSGFWRYLDLISFAVVCGQHASSHSLRDVVHFVDDCPHRESVGIPAQVETSPGKDLSTTHPIPEKVPRSGLVYSDWRLYNEGIVKERVAAFLEMFE